MCVCYCKVSPQSVFTVGQIFNKSPFSPCCFQFYVLESEPETFQVKKKLMSVNPVGERRVRGRSASIFSPVLLYLHSLLYLWLFFIIILLSRSTKCPASVPFDPREPCRQICTEQKRITDSINMSGLG